MRYTLRCVKLNGDSEYYDKVHFINTSSKSVSMYFKDDVIRIAIKDYRYIKIIPNKEVNNE